MELFKRLKRFLHLEEKSSDITSSSPRITSVMGQPTLMLSPLSGVVTLLSDEDIISWMKCCKLVF